MPSITNPTSVFGRFTTGRRQTGQSIAGAQERGYATDLSLPLDSQQSLVSEEEKERSDIGGGLGYNPAVTPNSSGRNRLRKQSIGSHHHRRESSSLLSLTASVTDLTETVKRSVSLRSHRTALSSGSVGSVGSPTLGGAPFGHHRSKSPGSGALFSTLAGSPLESPEEVPVAPLLPPGPPPPVPPTTSRPSLKKSLSQRFTKINASSDALKIYNSPPPPLPPPVSQDGSVNRPPRQPNERARSPSNPMLKFGPTVPLPRRPTDPRPSTNASNANFGGGSRDIHSSYGGSGAGAPALPTAPIRDTVTAASVAGNQNPTVIFQHIQEISAKRMATMDYLRQVHEGNIFYFSTLHYSPAALSSMPSLYPHKLGRRATNYFVLGYSLPGVLEQHGSGTPIEYLKALAALLTEFENYQNLAGYDSSGTTISRGRMTQMLKSSMSLGGRSSKTRRSSSGTGANTPASSIFDSNPSLTTSNLQPNSAISASTTPTTPNPLTPNHNLPPPTDALDAYTTAITTHATSSEPAYTHLLTPHLAFEPDFATTLATLCDTLIDCYAKLMELVSGPEACAPGLAEAFTKADKLVRKLLVANVVREFEDVTRAGVRGEVAGLGKVVLGGLM